MKQRLLRTILCTVCTIAALSGARAQMLQTLISSPGNRNELVTSVRALPDGSAVLGGYIYDIVSGQAANIDMLLLRVRADGSIIWQKQIASATGGDDLLKVVRITQNNNILVVGTMGRSAAYTNNTAVVFRFDTAGSLLWQRCVRITPGAGSAGDVIEDITELANGTIIAVGGDDAAPNLAKSMICSLTPGGVINYIETRDRISSDAFLGVTSAGNDAIITGWWDGASYKDIRVLRYTPGTTSGTIVWDNSYDLSGARNASGLIMGSNALVQVYVRSGKVVASGNSAQTWNNSPGIQTVFRCDLATGANATIRGLLVKGATYVNNSAFYPVDSANFYVAENPAPTFQDAVLWTSPSFSNGQISRIRPFATSGQVQASREFNLPGSQSIFSIDGIDSALFMAGCSNAGTTMVNNDIYFVASMSSLTNPNRTCDLIDDSMWVTSPALTVETVADTVLHPASTATFTVNFSNPGLVSAKACGEVFDFIKRPPVDTSKHTTTIPELAGKGLFRLYPNPAAGAIHLELPGGALKRIATILVMNATGQLVKTTAVVFDASGKAAFNTDELATGNYFLQLRTDDGAIGVQPFTVLR